MLRHSAKRTAAFLLLAAFVLTIGLPLGGCTPKSAAALAADIRTYRDIPGITGEEIDAIEALKQSRDSFVYGHLLQTESFMQSDGTLDGFTIRLCVLLSELFGIEFTPVLYDQWPVMRADLDGGVLDFTGGMTSTPERREVYSMSYPIAQRSLRVFTMAEDMSITKESDVNGKRIGFFAGTINADYIMNAYPSMDFEIHYFSTYDEGADMLARGEIDAIIADAVLDPAFAAFGFIRSTEMFPLVFIPVSLTTARDELTPIIEVLSKYINAGGIDRLNSIYQEGNAAYAKQKLRNSFTPEDLAYIAGITDAGGGVRVAFEADNYPVSFYNSKEREFQGIAVDVLKEVSAMTGLSFETYTDENTSFATMMEMLVSGEVSMVSELLMTGERLGNFLWSQVPYSTSRYALISRNEYATVQPHQVSRMKMGATKNTAYELQYHAWFPDNDNLTTFNTQFNAFNALENGSIDLLMASEILLLTLTNYKEKTDFKINYSFNEPVHSYFGFHLGEEQLRSIVDKTQSFINVDVIYNNWLNRTYDYTKKQATVRANYLLVLVAVLVASLLLVMYLFKKNRSSEERARIASKAKSDFLAHMSHEIRTPLNAIISLSKIAKGSTDDVDKVESSLNQILVSSHYLLGVLNDVLDMSKIESGKLELSVAPFRLSDACREVADIMDQRFREKNIRFILGFDTPKNDMVMGDKLRLNQVLMNLLGNAVKFTSEGGEVRFTMLVLEETDTHICLRYEVADSGIGMSSQQMDKLFTPFEQTDKSIAVRYGGTGLGLSISQSLLHMMGGEIAVESRQGKGSAFRFELCLPKCEAEVKTEAEMKTPYLAGKRILVAEDIEINRYILKELLAPTLAEIDEAENGFAALEKFQDRAPGYYQLVIMDIQMPGIDGYETTRRLRALNRPDAKLVPIVAMTANVFKEDVHQAIEAGMNGHLAKPVDTQALMETLKRFM